jgi:hypothetical protein
MGRRDVGVGGVQTTITQAVSPAQQRQFETKFAKYFFTTLTPLVRLNSPELKAALAVLGATPPNRKLVATKLLDDAFNAALERVVEAAANCAYICITMDGWKKRSCEKGAPLIMVVLLLPDGASHFWKVRLWHRLPLFTHHRTRKRVPE